MSTKTSIKRIALVAVSALGFGLLSIVPSNSAVQADVVSLSASTNSVIRGATVTNNITMSFQDTNTNADTLTAKVEVLTAPLSSVAIPDLETATVTSGDTLTVVTSGGADDSFRLESSGSAAKFVSGTGVISFTPAVIGTYVIRVTPSGGLNTTPLTWTLTVSDKAPASTAATTAVIVPEAGTETLTATSFEASSAVAARADIVVTASNGATSGAELTNSDAESKTATITGPGTLKWNGGSTGRTVISTASTLNETLTVYADGNAGASVITITDGSFTKTINVYFYGALASYVATVDKDNVGIGETATITVVRKDALGYVLPDAAIFASSSLTTVATAESTVSDGTLVVTGVAAGTSVITIGNASTGATVTLPVSIEVRSVAETTVSMTLNKEVYTPGELATLTIRATDVNGNPIADGTRTLLTTGGIVSSKAVQVLSGQLNASSFAIVDGNAVVTFYVPMEVGPVTLTATQDNAAATALSESYRVVTSGAATVSSSQVVGSVDTVPFAGEGNATAKFDITLTGDSTAAGSVTFALANKPSGSTATLSSVTATGNGVVSGNAVTVTIAASGSGTSTATVTINGPLSAGNYRITATPSPAMASTGATVQSVEFNITGRASDEARLTSITTAAAGANLGTVKDPVVVVAGGTVASPAPAGVSTIRLRADLISFPAGGYVNTFASAPSSVALGRFPNGVPSVDTNSNMVTYLGTFVGCSPTNAAHKAATYTASTNTISAAAGCDIVAARAGNATLAATGAGIFTFTPTVAGDYVLRVWQDANNDGILNVNEVRSERTITVGAYSSWSSQYSTSFINAVSPSAATGVASKKATTQTALGDFTGDETILAPKGTVTAATFVKVARVKVTLKDADDVALDSRSTFPTITATITGPGTLAIDATGAAVTPVGRAVSYTPTSLLTNDGGPEVFYVNIFNDGNAGASSIEIKIGSTVFATETLKFYGAVTAVAATNGLKVLPATAGTYGCVTSTTACGSLTVATTPAVKLVATDANGTPVPYRTYSAVSSADTVFAGIPATAPAAGALVSETDGAAWFPVSVLAGGTTVKSGATGTLTYSTNTGTATAPVLVPGSALTFSLGGAAASATLAITGNKNVGDKAAMTFTVKDAAGNAAFDKDHSIALKSNIALTTAVGQLAAAANAIAVRNGTSSIDFFNPLVAGTVNIEALIDGLLAVSASSTVTNAAQDASNEAIAAAQDAAAEAIDAANAATDAANLAAEAADAATVAAEEARDAADAATAAVEELATQVATLMAALKAQITTLANTVAKIAKKVRA